MGSSNLKVTKSIRGNKKDFYFTLITGHALLYFKAWRKDNFC